jgi:hypothetical protein
MPLPQGQTEVAIARQQPRAGAAKPAAEQKQLPARVRIDAGQEALIAELEGPLREQFQPLVKAELFFVRTVCHPTKDEYAQIAAMGDDALKSAVRNYADVQRLVMRGQTRSNEMPTLPDPRQLIAEALGKSVVEILSAEQAAAYKEQIEKRAEHRKRVTILNLVAKLDRELVLTSEQRDKLAATLSEHWNDAWSQSMEMLTLGDQFFPVLPDNRVLPILNEIQKAAWREVPKVQGRVFGWAGNMGLLQSVWLDDALWEPDEKTDFRTTDKLQGVNR